MSIDSRGYSIGYEVSGSGPPLVLVDGFTMWAEQWVTAGYVSALEGRYRVIRVDPLGHGQSDKPHDAGAYTWRACISDLLAVVDAEHIDRAHWWGFSRGAFLVQDLAHFYPERVISAIFGSPVEDTGAVEMPAEPVPELFRMPGGIERWWAAHGFSDPEQVAVALSVNDVEALACVVEGMIQSEADGEFPEYESWNMPALTYKGSIERHYEPVLALLADGRMEGHEVVGASHYDAFARSEDVLAFAEPFLQRWS